MPGRCKAWLKFMRGSVVTLPLFLLLLFAITFIYFYYYLCFISFICRLFNAIQSYTIIQHHRHQKSNRMLFSSFIQLGMIPSSAKASTCLPGVHPSLFETLLPQSIFLRNCLIQRSCSPLKGNEWQHDSTNPNRHPGRWMRLVNLALRAPQGFRGSHPATRFPSKQ